MKKAIELPKLPETTRTINREEAAGLIESRGATFEIYWRGRAPYSTVLESAEELVSWHHGKLSNIVKAAFIKETSSTVYYSWTRKYRLQLTSSDGSVESFMLKFEMPETNID